MYALTPEELLNYCAEETSRWRDWFKSHSEALDLSTDIAGSKNVREVVLHIAAVELRYSERLLEQPVTDYDQLSTRTVEDLFAVFARSQDYMREFLSQAQDADWEKVMTFPTRSAGTLTASKRKIFIHTYLHGVRHWAQLASFLRQQGHKQDWYHDFLFTNVMQ
jgi:uncharacterized damage-inducible protein DinB